MTAYILPVTFYGKRASRQARGYTNSMRTIVLQLIGIIICGGIGAVAGWSVIQLTGIGGTLGALLMIPVAVVVAAAAWLAGVWLHDRHRKPDINGA